VLLIALKAAALVLAAGSGVFSYVRSEQRHRESAEARSRRDAMAELEATLFSCIQNLFVGERLPTIRANVMTAEEDELRMPASANMRVYSDYRVRLKKGQGCAGLAWQRAVDGPVAECAQPVYVPKAQLTTASLRRKWKLTEEQIRLTSHILWILSIPLFSKGGSQRVSASPRGKGLRNWWLKRKRRIHRELTAGLAAGYLLVLQRFFAL